MHPDGLWLHSSGDDLHGYTDVCYPTGVDPDQVLSVAYHDNYDWLTDGDYAFRIADALGGERSNAVTGLSTGTKTKVLDSRSSTPQWLTSVVYYDERYRSIQTVSGLYPSGIEVVSNTHDFTGQVTRTRVQQTIGDQTIGYDKWFNYDPRGRLQSIEQQIAGDTDNGKVRISEYVYDDKGSVVQKSLHNGIEPTDYEYRLTGQQTAVYSPSFSYRLGFDRPADGNLSSSVEGNLASMAWGSGTTLDKGYTYNYNRTGELISATLHERSASGDWTGSTSRGEHGMSYDSNNNILSVERTDGDGATMHDLRYHYDGNRLMDINDGGSFEYDVEGNMTYDGHSDIGIQYNILGLPEQIFAGSDTISYIYSASGERLASKFTSPGVSSSTYYRSVMVYGDDNELRYMLQPEGLITREGNAWTYKYFQTDHTGSTRVLLAARNGSLEVEQTTDYYPFGLAWETNNLHLNRYLYSGKEIEDAVLDGSPLALYYFGARYYNPILGRWFNVDPALQCPSPYQYCGNNPVLYTDPNGEVFGIDDLIMVGVMAYFGGLQANFMSTAHNPFDPGSWNWSSANTYIGVISGAIGGAGMAGVNIPGQMPGFLPNGVLQAGVNVTLNGIGNVTEGHSFFDNWYMSAGWGFLMGGMAGYELADRHHGNPWTGSNMKFDVNAVVEVGDISCCLDRSNETVESIIANDLGGRPRNLDLVYAEGSIPSGYTRDGNIVRNPEGISVAGTTVRKNIFGRSDMYIYDKAFIDYKTLRGVIGHELVHVNLNRGIFLNSLASINFEESVAYRWSYEDALRYNPGAAQGYLERYNKWSGNAPFDPFLKVYWPTRY